MRPPEGELGMDAQIPGEGQTLDSEGRVVSVHEAQRMKKAFHANAKAIQNRIHYFKREEEKIGGTWRKFVDKPRRLKMGVLALWNGGWRRKTYRLRGKPERILIVCAQPIRKQTRKRLRRSKPTRRSAR